MRRYLTLALVLAALVFGSSACGGQTGLEVRVDVPPSWQAGSDFDTIFVQVESSGETTGTNFAVQPSTPIPYYVYIYVDDAKYFQWKVTASLKLKGAVKSQLVKAEAFEPGEILSIVMTMPGPT